MERYFRTVDGQLVNLMDHIIQQIEKTPNLSIYIGTDSQNSSKKGKRGNRTTYVSVVLFRYGRRGAHFVYSKTHVTKIKDRYTRLSKEAEMTIELAEKITSEIPVKITALEFDFNSRIVTESTRVVAPAVGWAESLGYAAKVKPETLLSIRAADHICKE